MTWTEIIRRRLRGTQLLAAVAIALALVRRGGCKK